MQKLFWSKNGSLLVSMHEGRLDASIIGYIYHSGEQSSSPWRFTYYANNTGISPEGWYFSDSAREALITKISNEINDVVPVYKGEEYIPPYTVDADEEKLFWSQNGLLLLSTREGSNSASVIGRVYFVSSELYAHPWRFTCYLNNEHFNNVEHYPSQSTARAALTSDLLNRVDCEVPMYYKQMGSY